MLQSPKMHYHNWKRTALTSHVSITSPTPVPAPVTGLQVQNRNQTSSLWFSWERAAGDFRGYSVHLYNPSGSQHAEKSLGPDAGEHVFHGLVAGRLYSAVVVTLSGDLSNRATMRGRTGQSLSSCLIKSLHVIFSLRFFLG